MQFFCNIVKDFSYLTAQKFRFRKELLYGFRHHVKIYQDGQFYCFIIFLHPGR